MRLFTISNTSDFTCAQAWDTSRSRNNDTLDAILESLGTHVVPPGFHENASGSSIFLDPSSESESEERHNVPAPDHSPALTIRRGNGFVVGTSRKVGKLKDKSHWKTLRDFVDERAIEDALETIETERNKLDVRQQAFRFINLDSIDHITTG